MIAPEDGRLPTERVIPCVGSGYCCKTAPCPYGKVSPETGWCENLIPWDADFPLPRYRCARYEFIRMQPLADLVPAFGAGCSSSAFNVERSAIVRELRKRVG